jgi:hypothetical protein
MTSPIFLLYLLWHLIDCCSRWAEPGETLHMGLDSATGSISIQFHGCTTMNPELRAEMEAGDLRILLALLGFSLEMDAAQPGMSLSFQNNPVEAG